MRPSSAGFREHRIPIERQELGVPGWPPREGVDPIKTEHMINTEDVENSFYPAHALAPPCKILRSQRGPVVDRDPPVLTPFYRELVILEIRLGRRAARPIEMKNLTLAENIGAVIT